MITFVNKMGDTALLRVICCNESRYCATVNGYDMVNLDDVLNNLNNDKNINHVNLALNYAENEDEVLKWIEKQKNSQDKKQSNNILDKNVKDTQEEEILKKKIKDNKKEDYKCPSCGSDKALMDKEGNKYPCISCIYIDVAQKLMSKFGKEFKQSIDQQNILLESFKNLIPKEDHD